jgi:hypothetical protein
MICLDPNTNPETNHVLITFIQLNQYVRVQQPFKISYTSTHWIVPMCVEI